MREQSEDSSPARMKRTRPGSKYNANNDPNLKRVDLGHYTFITFPPDCPVQPGDQVKFTMVTGSEWLGVVVDEAQLNNDVLKVGVRFGSETITKLMPVTDLEKIFDYAALDAETRIVVQQKTGEIKTLMKRAAQDIIDIGGKLIEVKTRLGAVAFGKWLSVEFEWTDRTARNFMYVAEAFKSENFSEMKFAPSALYLLAAPSTPEPARTEAVSRATGGETITHKLAQTIIGQHKAPASPNAISPQATINAVGAVPVPPVPPSPVRYGKKIDDYVDEVPSVSVDEVQAELNKLPEGNPLKLKVSTLLAHVQNQLADERAVQLANDAAQQSRVLAAQTPPPAGKYRCIVIDPPWPVEKIVREVRPNQTRHLDYPVLSLDEIMALKLPDLADEQCHLYLWVTQKFLPYGLQLAQVWGFNYQCLMTWVKPGGMTPYSFMYNTEHVIFAARGGLRLQQMGLKLSFEAPSAGHSIKPDVFYERVLLASPGPRLDMFARVEREGFVSWGNEVEHKPVSKITTSEMAKVDAQPTTAAS